MDSEIKPELLPCPFCGATPHRGLGKVQHDQLRGEPFQRYSIWCPRSHAKIDEMNERQAVAAWNTRPATHRLAAYEAGIRAGLEWQPIENAPEVKGKYFFCRLVWGPSDDRCTGDGFRWDGRWFAAGLFYKTNRRFDECQYEFRQIEIAPTHWQPLPAPPIDPSSIEQGGGV